jgi:hypothetical protein
MLKKKREELESDFKLKLVKFSSFLSSKLIECGIFSYKKVEFG